MNVDHCGGRFTVIEQIGGGNYGTLFRVIDSEATSLGQRIIATKKLKDAINHPHVLREVSVQRHAQRCTRHVARLLHVVPRDHVRAALVLEYIPLDLRIFLNTFYCDQAESSAPTWCTTVNGGGEVKGSPPTHVPLVYVRRMVRGLLEALRSLHARGIAHRDVKPENILVEPLGLDHPLRCVCPPLASSTVGTAGGSSSGRDDSQDAAAAECCWVHARRAPHAGNGAAEDEVCGASSSSSSAATDDTLEPCRWFFGRTVALHHELTGDDLARAIHILHCSACRRATCATAADDAEAEKQSEKPSLCGSGQLADCSGDVVVQMNTTPSADVVAEEVTMNQASGSGDAASVAEEEVQRSGQHSNGSAAAAAAAPTCSAPLSPDVKLCDFGSARHIGTLRLRSAEEQREELTPGPTTPVYCAPEMMLLQQYGTPVDMWAVGVILFEMLTGEFFLSVGTLRSFYGDLVVHDDYCVMHRLNMMFRHLGTPSLEEWRSMAHPLYYPDAVLPHLPQIPSASLFKCLPPKRRSSCGAARTVLGAVVHSEATSNEEATAYADGGDDNDDDGGDTSGCGVVNGDEESGEGCTRDATTSIHPPISHTAAASRDAPVPDLSKFLLHHIGPCGMDFLRSLLRYNPNDRLTAAEALQHPFLAPTSQPNCNGVDSVDC
jgi:serine/threonine protein kinase